MSALEGLPHPAAYTHHDAEIARIEHVLRHYGVLTRARLREYTGAEAWRGNGFEAALADAVRAGRVRELTPELYEIVD